MNLKHKVSIRVTRPDGGKAPEGRRYRRDAR